MDYFYRISDIKLFFIISFAFIVVSVMAIFIVRRFISHELRNRDNPVIGNISSLISIIYGVLAGLMSLYLINNINYTEEAVQHEANAIANIYRDTQWLKDPVRTSIQMALKNYMLEVINVEWPLMKNAQPINTDGDIMINNISNTLRDYNAVTRAEAVIIRDILEEVKSLYNARQQRISISHTQLSAEIWLVIFVGTILTIAINFLFAMNFYMHLITVSGVALMAAAMSFLLITLDRPFQGEFSVEPTAFQTVLDFEKVHYEKPVKEIFNT